MDKLGKAYEDQLKTEMIQNTSDDLLKLIIVNMKNHGPDPESVMLVAAAMCMTILKMSVVTPGFDEKIIQLLKSKDIQKLLGDLP